MNLVIRRSKLQHHATSSYETENLPEVSFYIISNGGMIRRKIGKYAFETAPEAKIICTNGRDNPLEYCSYFDKKINAATTAYLARK